MMTSPMTRLGLEQGQKWKLEKRILYKDAKRILSSPKLTRFCQTWPFFLFFSLPPLPPPAFLVPKVVGIYFVPALFCPHWSWHLVPLAYNDPQSLSFLCVAFVRVDAVCAASCDGSFCSLAGLPRTLRITSRSLNSNTIWCVWPKCPATLSQWIVIAIVIPPRDLLSRPGGLRFSCLLPLFGSVVLAFKETLEKVKILIKIWKSGFEKLKKDRFQIFTVDVFLSCIQKPFSCSTPPLSLRRLVVDTSFFLANFSGSKKIHRCFVLVTGNFFSHQLAMGA